MFGVKGFGFSKIMSIDVESIGLHGEGFSVGWCVMGLQSFEVLALGSFQCSTTLCEGEDRDREWVVGNCEVNEPPKNIRGLEVAFQFFDSPKNLRKAFFTVMRLYAAQGCVFAADCPYPVETNLIHSYIKEQVKNPSFNSFNGPYPFLDITSMLLARGVNPMVEVERLDYEIKHSALGDSLQSLRLLVESYDESMLFPDDKIQVVDIGIKSVNPFDSLEGRELGGAFYASMYNAFGVNS